MKSLERASLYRTIEDLTQRLEVVENRVFKNKKAPTSLSQQMLMLQHLGMIDKIYELDIPNTKKAELLSILLNSDYSNTKKALEALAKKEDTHVHLPSNFKYLRDKFEEVELHDLSNKMNAILNKFEE